ncbi:UPF0728 protein C10orf53-like [Mizuhopecten yessoensis]|uniref:UPF0728 protein C10orf53-like n=1 Tax=Mizuhopecten yessoensis TaxID=6573 RepID=A0A210PM07_MIZYE|nr:UPF0728 protein C10orf53-like [Mizuhopecten yessoensis]
MDPTRAAIACSGHVVITQKTEKHEACEVYIDSKRVWSCNIKGLQPGDGHSHPLCVEALKAIKAHRAS